MDAQSFKNIRLVDKYHNQIFQPYEKYADLFIDHKMTIMNYIGKSPIIINTPLPNLFKDEKFKYIYDTNTTIKEKFQRYKINDYDLNLMRTNETVKYEELKKLMKRVPAGICSTANITFWEFIKEPDFWNNNGLCIIFNG
jgi:hypothetical protein